MTVSRLTATEKPDWPGDAYTLAQVDAKLTYWSEHWRELGSVNQVLTRSEVLGTLDKWLDERLAVRGR